MLRHLPLREAAYAVGFVAVLAAVYVGAYAANVEHGRIRLEYLDEDDPATWRVLASYRVGGDWAATAFRPIHYLDAIVRQRTWSAYHETFRRQEEDRVRWLERHR
jgi:hypothetical protein